MGEWRYRHEIREVLKLSLASSNLDTALAPTKRAAEQVFLRMRLMLRIWTVVLDELLSDDPEVESGHSTYFSVVCDYRGRPLLFYDGPEGKFLTTAKGVCQKLRRFAGGWNTAEIVEELGFDSLSILVTSCREEASKKLKCH